MGETKSDPPENIDRERETIPPDFRECVTRMDEVEPQTIPDFCNVIVAQAHVLLDSKQLDSRTKVRLRLIVGDVGRALQPTAEKSTILLREEVKRVLVDHIPEIAKAMRTVATPLPLSEKTAYVCFIQACSRFE